MTGKKTEREEIFAHTKAIISALKRERLNYLDLPKQILLLPSVKESRNRLQESIWWLEKFIADWEFTPSKEFSPLKSEEE